MRTPSNERLFERFRTRGDAAALARLFDRTAPHLLAVARHLVRDAGEAEDVLQATFVVALESAARFERGRPVLPWMLGILGRQASAARRRAGRVVDPTRLEPRAVPDPAQLVAGEELARAVEQALAELPAPYDRVLRLHLAEGLAPAAIAERLGRRAGTVRVQLHRGLALLRRALPAGFAAGAAGLGSARGLAAVRVEVLRLADSLVPGLAAKGAAGAAGGLLGGTLVLAKTQLLVAAALALGAGLYVGLADPFRRAPRLEPLLPATAAPTSVAELPREVPRGGAPAARTQREALAAATAPDVAAPPSSSSTAPALVGRVLDRATRRALAAARVTLFVPGGAAPVGTRTDAEGGFRVAVGEAGVVGLQVESAGYAPLRAAPWYATTGGEPLRVAPGETYDAGVLFADPGVQVTGRVLDADGAGVPRALLWRIQTYPPASLARDVRGAPEGRARRDGSFVLRERIPYAGATDYGHAVLAASAQGVGWRELEMLEGEGAERVFDVTVGPGGTLEVRGVTESGRPAAGAVAQLHPGFAPLDRLLPLWDAAWGPLLVERFSRPLDDAGSARFEGLPLPAEGPARYLLRLVRAGAPTATREVLVDRDGGVVELAEGRTGRILVSGTIRAGDGLPVADARVTALGNETRSDARGAYTLTLLPVGPERCTVRAAADGLATRERAVELTAAEHLEGVDLRLPRPAPIAGIVVDQVGRPVAGAHVSLHSEAAHEPGEGLLPENGLVRTSADGRFRVEWAAAGTWYLVAHPPVGPGEWRGFSRLRVDGGSLDVRVELERAELGRGRLTLSLFDERTGEPLDAALTRLVSRDLEAGAVVQSADVRRVAGGVVVDGLRPGRWRLWVAAAGRAPGHVDVEVRGDERIERRLELGAPARILGRLRLPGGDLGAEVLGSGVVTVEFDEPRTLPFGVPWGVAGEGAHRRPELTAEATFEVTDLLPGRHVVRAYLGSRLASLVVDLAPGHTEEVELLLVPGGWLGFRGDAPDMPGHVRVRVWSSDGAWTSPEAYAARGAEGLSLGLLAPAGQVEWEALFRPEGSSNVEAEVRIGGRLEVEPFTSQELRLPRF